MCKLVIIESPGKVQKIQTILGSNYKVISSGIMGHSDAFYQDLIERGFIKNVPEFDKEAYGKIIDNLKNAIDESTEVFLAMENDMFGEQVARTIINEFNLSNYKRIYFNCITTEEVLSQF